MVSVRVSWSEFWVRVLICPSEPFRERVKVIRVIAECRVINCMLDTFARARNPPQGSH